MTKYVLNSGGVKNNPTKAKEFFAEIFRDLGANPRILLCYFAQPRELWETKFMQEEKAIPSLVPEGVSPILELAFPSKFEQQIKNSDILYIKGGDDYLIRYWFDKFNIPEIWKGKVIATNSASSDVLSKHFWTGDWRELMDGLGVLPIKFLAHYKSSMGNDDPRGPIKWEEAYESLRNYGNSDLPIHALEEGHYIVIED